MTTSAHIPYSVAQDEDGIWCAHAVFATDRVHGGANGQGTTKDAAIADLHEALTLMVDEYGLPRSAVVPMVLDVA